MNEHDRQLLAAAAHAQEIFSQPVYRIRVVQGSYNSIANAKFHMAPPNVTPFPLSSSSIQTDFMEKQVPEGVPFSCHSEEKIFEAHKEPEVKEESISSAAASIAAHEACKRWRLRWSLHLVF